jgi:hypothetical protein
MTRHSLARALTAFALTAVALGAAACSSDTADPATAPAAAGARLLAAKAAKGGRAATTGVVYVTSQGLYYDTFVTRDPVPMEGPFQLLVNGTTEFGPGDPGYLGGRWWEDLNRNGIQDAGDHFFHCPLLPPGRPTP